MAKEAATLAAPVVKEETAAPAQKLVTLTQEQFDQLLNARNSQGQVSESVLASVFTSQGQQIQELIKETREQKRKENKQGIDFPEISALNPRGELEHPRTPLVDAQGRPREVYFYGKWNTHQLSQEEIDACNEIQDDCQARNGLWNATIGKGVVTQTKLTISISDTNPDARASLTSLIAILTELKTGELTVDLPTVLARAKAVEKENAKLQRQIEMLQSGEAVNSAK